MKILRLIAGCCVVVSFQMTRLLAASGVLEPGKLYLNVGTLNTATLENLSARGGIAAGTGAFQDGRPYVIQLDGPITPQRDAALRAAGVVVGEYLPQYAYVVNLSGVAPAAVAGFDFVAWIGEFQNEWKLDPELGRRASRLPDRQTMAQRGRVLAIITLFENRGAGQVVELLKSLPDTEIHWVQAEGPVMVICAAFRLIDAPRLAALDDVHYIEEAPEVALRNVTTRWIVQSNVQNLTPLYNNGITGAGQIVGVMDTQVNRDHCAFRDPVNNTPGPSHRKIVGYNTTFGYNPHGTHVACTAVGQDYAGSTGETRGVAYGGRLSYSPIPSYPFTETGFYNATLNAHIQGARVHTNSWGNDETTSYDGLCRGIDRFSYDNEDDLVCFSITSQYPTLRNPENAKNLLAVGASQDAPTQQALCEGGAGPTADGRRKPDIFAPGCNIASAIGDGQVCTTDVMTGTSMASPAVAGAGLLVRQYYRDGYYPTGVATPANGFFPSGALVKATLLNSCADMTGITGYPSDQEGWGRVLLDDTLYFPGDSRKPLVLADIRNANGLSTGQENMWYLNVTGSLNPLHITLAWMDPPASASTGTANAAVNDLDLELTTPSAGKYLGNYFQNGSSVLGGVKDSKNNVEQILVAAPATSVWILKVKAAAVNQGLQGYALLLTGQASTSIPPPSVTTISPTSWNSGQVLGGITILGDNYFTLGTTTVRLKQFGRPDIVATNVSLLSTSRISCVFDLTAAEPGDWDVEVTNPDLQTGVLVRGFHVNLVCLKGDVNYDGWVNGADIQRFKDILFGSTPLPVERCAGDVQSNPNGVIDMADIPNLVQCLLSAGCHP